MSFIFPGVSLGEVSFNILLLLGPFLWPLVFGARTLSPFFLLGSHFLFLSPASTLALHPPPPPARKPSLTPNSLCCSTPPMLSAHLRDQRLCVYLLACDFCVWEPACHSACEEVRGRLAGVNSFLLPSGSCVEFKSTNLAAGAFACWLPPTSTK